MKAQKVGILCAGDTEAAPFFSALSEYRVTEKAMLKFYEGTLAGMETVVLFSGVCKVNAAIASQLLIDLFGVDAIINAGTAGGLDPALEIFDTVISTEACYHDVAADILTEFHPLDGHRIFPGGSGTVGILPARRRQMASAGKVVWGRMATGESFITDEGRQKILTEFAPLTVDMETASIAHVCYVNKVPFLAVRCVTDTAAHSGVEHFEENCEKASLIAKDITFAILREMRAR